MRPSARALDHSRHNGEVNDQENPAEVGTIELDEAARTKRLGEVVGLINRMKPAVQADGGDLVLLRVDVEAGVVEVELTGSCSSCAVSSDTLQEGVERILRDRLPWVTEVIGHLDESMDDLESAALGRGGYVPRW